MKPERPETAAPVDPELFWSLADDAPSDAELDGLFAECSARLEAERGLVSWLRARPTSARVGLALGLPTGLVLATALLAPRPDLAALPVWRVLTVVLGTVALIAASVWFGLRPLHRPPAPAWVEPAVLGGAVVGALALTLLPLVGGGATEAPVHWGGALGCLYRGLVMTVPAFVILRALDRGGRSLARLLAAAAAGLGANGVLAMHCANDSLGHLVKGHALVPAGFVAAVALARWGWTQLGSARVG